MTGPFLIDGPVEIFYRLKKMLVYDFLSILPGGKYPFTGETFLHLLLYAGFILFILQMLFSPKFFSCNFQKSGNEIERVLPPDATEI